MSMHELLRKRAAANKPIRVGIIGAGRYGAMYVAQSKFIPGIQIVGVADLDLNKAKKSLIDSGWAAEAIVSAESSGAINDAAKRNQIGLTSDAFKLIQAEVDVIVEITGTVDAASRHSWCALEAKRHVVIVSVESVALVGLAMQKKAEENNVVYSFGYGDEPAALCELVDWARTSGFEIGCVGKYSNYLPEHRYANPDNVWEVRKNFPKERIASAQLNAKMFSSFADCTKALTEVCCAANATLLSPPRGGMKFPTIEYEDLATKLRPVSSGGILDYDETVEVPSTLYRDGTPTKRNLHWGVFLSMKAPSNYTASFMADFRYEHRIMADPEGKYAITYIPTHILGLELNKSVASAALLGLPTGCPKGFVADMVAVAKKDLRVGDELDGPGAYTTYGQLVRADESTKGKYLPAGLSERGKVIRPVAKDTILTYDDVELDKSSFSYKLRKDIEAGKY
jgi:predicted homoserine dehydrogenase-like protein